MSTFNVQNASKLLYQSIGLIDQEIDSFPARVPNIRESIARLDRNSPMYDLKKKSLDELVPKFLSDVNNLSNVVRTASEQLKAASERLKIVEREVCHVKADHEWAMAGSFGRVCLTASRTLSGAWDFVTYPITFVKENPKPLAAAAVLLAVGAAGFGAGYAAAVKG